MSSIAVWLNPTQIVGLTANLLAMVSCGVAWAKVSGPPHRNRLAAILAILEAALFVDMLFNGRWELHDLLVGEAMADSVYSGRTDPQIAVLCLLAGSALAGMGFIFWRFRKRPGASLAACGGFLSLICWCVEVVSLHAVDAIFYHKIHGFMTVSMVWITCALMTGLGILWDTVPNRIGMRLD
jgi:hypothetical protein